MLRIQSDVVDVDRCNANEVNRDVVVPINSLKNGKALCHDMITTEILKYMYENERDMLTSIIQKHEKKVGYQLTGKRA